MNRLAYILIPAVLAFSLFFGISASGAHDLAFGAGMPMNMGCSGSLCGLFPEVACSVHCLTSGLLQSLDSPVFALVSFAFVAVFAVLTLAVAILPRKRFQLVAVLDRPPPNAAHLTVQKRE